MTAAVYICLLPCCYGPLHGGTGAPVLLYCCTADATDHGMLVVLMGSASLGILILVFSDSLHVSVHAELVIISSTASSQQQQYS